MNFVTGDILLNRFRLVEVLRDEPGFSVWRAHDNSLQRTCQIFIVSNSTIISRVNTAASALALSQDPHFVQVLHLHRDGEVCVIVTDEDQGITLRDYLVGCASDSDAFPLSFDAIRSIIGELTSICQELDSNNQAHYCIDDLTVRLDNNGVLVANFPISAALLPPTAPRFKSTNHDVESVMVYQIGALAFEMLTGTPYRSVLAPRGRQMLHDAHTPDDLMLICTRSLCLPDDQGRTPIPLVTLLEMSILLDAFTSLKKLSAQSAHHINLDDHKASAPSITQAVFKHVSPDAIAALPASLKNTEIDHSQKTPEWSASELIFGGSKSVDLTQPDASTDLFHALGELDEHNLDYHYDPYDFNDFNDSDTQTAGLQTQDIRLAVTQQKQDNVSRETLNTSDADFATDTQVVPPVFAPHTSTSANSHTSQSAARSAHQNEKNENTALSGSSSSQEAAWLKSVKQILQSRAAAFIGIVLILAALLIGAFYSLGVGNLSPENADDPWTHIDQEKVPFPGQDNSENNSSEPKKSTEKAAQDSEDAKKKTAKKSESKTKKTQKSAVDQKSKKNVVAKDSNLKAEKLPANKAVKALPTPVGATNTTPITPRGYTFLNRPGGVRGWGYSFAFDQPSTFWKIEVGNAVGGGQVHIYADPSSDLPTSGTEVAHFSFADNGQVSTVILKKPVTASRLVVWVDGSDATTLPRIIKLTHYAFY
ncbi:hypothetical protein [Alloscardovia omnicolens]|uniref:hypothetical protein n=1 Tax=Alloscardovia omnicolens TaxID=419015 RepID=UPI003A778E4D